MTLSNHPADNDCAHPVPVIFWRENGANCQARWHSESANAAPQHVILADDTLSANAAFRLASAGTALLWRGDFQNARQLLQALARRLDRQVDRQVDREVDREVDRRVPATSFQQHRQAQAYRAAILGKLLLPVDAGYRIPLRRAPDVRQACQEAYGEENTEPFVVSLRELLGLIGAHEWRKKGVLIPVLGQRIHAHYGVFSPVRGEYLDLVSQAPLPETVQPTADSTAFDIGTGTAVLAALLVKRGFGAVIATDQDARALACAEENIQRLGLSAQIRVVKADLFPPGRAALLVCNPPWLPARPHSPLEHAVYDDESRMLKGFLAGLSTHLTPDGEGWLILSDLAEHLELRSRDELLALISAAGLRIIERLDTRPKHPRATDSTAPLHKARAAEVTSLFRLAAASRVGAGDTVVTAP